MDKRRLLLIGILAALPFLCYWEVLRGDVLLPMDWVYDEMEPWRQITSPDAVVNSRIKDAFIESYALDAVSARAAREGRILLWNPYAGSGMPHLAGGFTRMLLPSFWLHAVFRPDTARNLEILLYLFLAELFAFAFLRRIGCNLTGSFLGAVVYGFTPSLVHRAEISFILATLLWFPLLLYFVEAIVTDGRLRFVAGLAVAVAFQILAGYFPDIFINFLGAAVYGAVRASSLGRSSFLRRILLCFSGATLGACLAAPFLLPAIELILRSNRPINPAEALVASGLGPEVVLSLFSPWVTRSQLYIGLLPLLFVPSALRKHARGPAFGLVFVFGVGVMIATANPILGVIHDLVPGFQGLRYTSTMIALASFSLALLAGLGISKSVEDNFEKQKLLPLVLAASLGAIGLWGFLAEDERLAATFRFPGALLLLLFFIGGRALLRRKILGPRLFAVLVCVLISMELMSYGRKFNPRIDPAVFAPLPAFESIEFLKEDSDRFRVATLFGKSVFWPNTLGAYGIEDVAAYHSLLPGQLGRYMERTQRYLAGVTGERLFEDRETSGNWVSLESFRPSHLLRVWNIKYFIVPAGVENPDPEWLDLVYDKEVRILRFRGFLPRVFLASQALVLPDERGIFAKLVDARFDPASTVLLETEPLCHFPSGAVRAGDAVEAHAEVQGSDDASIRIETRAGEPTFLFLSVSHDPGWRAEIDGRPAPVLRANLNFQAVPLPAGSHEVVFRYEPASYGWGWVVLFAAGVGVFLLMWADRAARGSLWAGLCFFPVVVAVAGFVHAHSRSEIPFCGQLQVEQRFFSATSASPVGLDNGVTQSVSLPVPARIDWVLNRAPDAGAGVLRVRAAPSEDKIAAARTLGFGESGEEAVLRESRFERGNRWTYQETLVPPGTERLSFETVSEGSSSAALSVGSPLLLRPGLPVASEILFDLSRGDADWQIDYSVLSGGRRTTILLTRAPDREVLSEFDEVYRADDEDSFGLLMLRLLPHVHRIATVLVMRPRLEGDSADFGERQLELVRWELEKLGLEDEVTLRVYR